MALQIQSKMLAGNAGVSAEEAANVVPRVTIIPSETWGMNRAPESGLHVLRWRLRLHSKEWHPMALDLSASSSAATCA